MSSSIFLRGGAAVSSPSKPYNAFEQDALLHLCLTGTTTDRHNFLSLLKDEHVLNLFRNGSKEVLEEAIAFFQETNEHSLEFQATWISEALQNRHSPSLMLFQVEAISCWVEDTLNQRDSSWWNFPIETQARHLDSIHSVMRMDPNCMILFFQFLNEHSIECFTLFVNHRSLEKPFWMLSEMVGQWLTQEASSRSISGHRPQSPSIPRKISNLIKMGASLHIKLSPEASDNEEESLSPKETPTPDSDLEDLQMSPVEKRVYEELLVDYWHSLVELSRALEELEELAKEKYSNVFQEVAWCDKMIERLTAKTPLKELVTPDNRPIQAELNSCRMVVFESLCYLIPKHLETVSNSFRLTWLRLEKLEDSQINLYLETLRRHAEEAGKTQEIVDSFKSWKESSIRGVSTLINTFFQHFPEALVSDLTLNDEG